MGNLVRGEHRHTPGTRLGDQGIHGSSATQRNQAGNHKEAEEIHIEFLGRKWQMWIILRGLREYSRME